MALPLLLGLGGSALAGSAGILGGNALLAGALGSGLGSLLQGDDLGTAVGTGLMSYFGGKALGGMFGGNAAAEAAKEPLMVGGRELLTRAPTAAASGAGNILSSPAGATIQATGLEGIKQAATNPYALSALGTTGLIEASKPPKFEPMGDDYSDIPEAEAAKRRMMTPGPDYRPGKDPEFRFFQPMQEGGLAALKYQEGGEMTGQNDKELISSAVKAIKGQSEQPERVLGMFLSRYGEEALRDLVERVKSGEFDQNAMVDEGMVNGVGDGMDDMIPATLEGEQDVVLSDGEFIVPADVVSGLGNGSSDAGAKSLYEMMDRVREMRTGMAKQPEQVPQGMMLPA